MITEKDLQEAIAECLGQRNPDSSTCIKLAAFYTLRNDLYGNPSQAQSNSPPSYSFAAPTEQVETYVDYDSDSEFAQAINGLSSQRAWSIMDELVDAIRVVNPRLYAGVMRKIEEG